jgi:uncharacterized protein
MQILDGSLLLSASDLVNFLGCRHATHLDLRDLTDPVDISERDAATVLIFEKGLEHEWRYLASLKEQGLMVAEIPGEGFELPDRIVLTREAIRAGVEVIYQVALVVPPWLGYDRENRGMISIDAAREQMLKSKPLPAQQRRSFAAARGLRFC